MGLLDSHIRITQGSNRIKKNDFKDAAKFSIVKMQNICSSLSENVIETLLVVHRGKNIFFQVSVCL